MDHIVHNLTKKLCKGLHYRCESLLSYIYSDIGPAQNLQPIEICDEEGRQHARIGIYSELSGFLSPHDRVSVGFFELFQSSPNAHAHELILSGKFYRANLEKAGFRRRLEPEDLFEAPNNRCAGWSTPQIVDVCLQHSLDVAVERRQEHFVLAAECTVEAAFAETHFVKQHIERSCLIAAAPK